MATAAPSLLRATHVSGLHAVERELAAMHNELLRVGGEDARMVRLSVVNLVAVCQDAELAEMAAETVTRLAETHPARTIVVLADRGGDTAIEADLALHSAPQGGAGRVCSEELRLVVRGDPALHLSSVVTPLLVPDVPVHLWLVGAPPLDQALDHDVVGLCERLVVDTDAYGDIPATLRQLAAAASREDLPVADLAWARSRPWRERIAQSFDGPAMRGFSRHITDVTVESGGAAPSAQAWLLAGWITARAALHRPAGATAGPLEEPPTASVRAHPDDPHGVEHPLVRVTLRCDVDGHTARVSIVRDATALHSVIEVDGGLSAGTTVLYDIPSTVTLVGSLVEEADPDPVYLDALAAAAALSEPAA